MSTKKVDMRTSRKSGPVSYPDQTNSNSRPSRSCKKVLPNDEVSSQNISRKNGLMATKQSDKRKPKSLAVSKVLDLKKSKSKTRKLKVSSKTKLNKVEAVNSKIIQEAGLRPRRSNAANYIAKKFLEDTVETVQKKRTKQKKPHKAKYPSYTAPPFQAYTHRSRRGRLPKYSPMRREPIPSYYGSIGYDDKDVDTGPSYSQYHPKEAYPLYDGYNLSGSHHSDFFIGESNNYSRNGRASFAARREYTSQMDAFFDDPSMMTDEMSIFDRPRSRLRDRISHNMEQDMFLDASQDPTPGHRRKSPIRVVRNPNTPQSAVDEIANSYDELAKKSSNLEENPTKMQFEAATTLAQVREAFEQQINQQDLSTNNQLEHVDPNMLDREAYFSQRDYEEFQDSSDQNIFEQDDLAYYEARGQMPRGEMHDIGHIRRARRRYPVGKSVGIPRKGPPTILKRLSAGSENNAQTTPTSTSSNVAVRPPPFSSFNNKVIINSGSTPKMVGVSSQNDPQTHKTIILPSPQSNVTGSIKGPTTSQIVSGQPVVKILASGSQSQPVVLKTCDNNATTEIQPPVDSHAMPVPETPIPQTTKFIATTNVNGTRTFIPASALGLQPTTATIVRQVPNSVPVPPPEPTASELLFGKRPSAPPPQSVPNTPQFAYISQSLAPKFTVASPFGMNLIASQHKKVVLLPSNGTGSSGPTRVIAVNSASQPSPALLSNNGPMPTSPALSPTGLPQ